MNFVNIINCISLIENLWYQSLCVAEPVIQARKIIFL